MNRKFKRILIAVLGVIFLILGVAGLALPFLQGFLFLAIGIVLLSLISPGLNGWLEIQMKKYPKIYDKFKKAERWVKKLFPME